MNESMNPVGAATPPGKSKIKKFFRGMRSLLSKVQLLFCENRHIPGYLGAFDYRLVFPPAHDSGRHRRIICPQTPKSTGHYLRQGL